MADLLGDSANYGSDCGIATDGDGGADASPSHASQSNEQNAHQNDSEDSEESEGSQEFTRTMHDASRALRHKIIRKRKLQRRGIFDSDEEMSDEVDSELTKKNTPFRKLSMPINFTPPRKKSKVLVRDSDEEDFDDDDDDEEEEEESSLVVPRA